MATADALLLDELKQFLIYIEPTRLPQRADGGRYAVALAPCCTPALRTRCEAADAALARLRSATREDERPGVAAAHAEAVVAAARAAASAVAAVRGALDAGDAKHARVAPGGLAVKWISSLGSDDAVGGAADYDAKKPKFAVAEALLPTLRACVRVDEALTCAAGARAGQRQAARVLAEDSESGVARATGALKAAAGAWRAAAAVDAPAAAPGWRVFDMPPEAAPAVANACGDACLAAADRLTAGKGLALDNPVTARLADGAADRAASAAIALGAVDAAAAAPTAVAALVAWAAADLVRARRAAAAGDAKSFGNAVAHARLGRDRLDVLAGSDAPWPGGPPAAAALVKLAGRTTTGRLRAAAATYFEELNHTNERVYYSRVPDAAPPADAPVTLAREVTFMPESGQPAPLTEPADDDPLLKAFDAARFEAVAARRESTATARREDQDLATSQQELLVAAREGRLDRRDEQTEVAAAQRGLGAVHSFFERAPAPPAARPPWTGDDVPRPPDEPCADTLAERLGRLRPSPAHSESEDRRYAERLRAQLDEERARERAENEARDAAYARSLQEEFSRAPPPPQPGDGQWTTYADPDTGHAYDYNASTGQSRWATTPQDETPIYDEPPPPPRNPFA